MPSDARRARAHGRKRWKPSFMAPLGNDGFVPAPVAGSLRTRAPLGSDFGVFGKGKRVLHVDPEIAHGVLDLAMAEKDLNGP